MNPATAVSPVAPARIGQRPDQGRRKGADEQFRRALDQQSEDQGKEPGAKPPVSPMPTELQRPAVASRQGTQPQVHHVDVIA